MITNQVLEQIYDQATSCERFVHKGQVINQDQIFKGQKLVVHGPGEAQEKVTLIRGPFRCDGNLCIELSFKNGLYRKTFSLADLAIIRKDDGSWNGDFWLARY